MIPRLKTMLTQPQYAKADGLLIAIDTIYPPVGNGQGEYVTESDRLRALIRDSSVTCNSRWVASTFAGSTYSMQYSTLPGWHATDLLPTFWDYDLENNALGAVLAVLLPGFTDFAEAYQSYLTSFVRSGNPNTYHAQSWFTSPQMINWPLTEVGDGEEISNVLDAREAAFSLISDTQNLKTNCDFWLNFQAAVTMGGGYAPPGAVVESNLLNSSFVAAASANY
jgi:hypothetical protein